ncbi:hypothetical protein [Flavobacterium adhaerens]|uniref:hypothetical protein n=1 Tax=Flavobacterium adhaerens TaxID=3149043 RepID=UPI0032B4C756
MSNEIKTNNDAAGYIRLIGNITLIAGIVFLIKSQLMETTIENNPENINVETLMELPKFIADKTNFTLLGGFLIIIGLQLSLVSNKIISDIIEQFKNPV